MASKAKSISNAEIKRSLVNQLETDLLEFRDACTQIPVDSVDPKLRTAIYELGLDILHFIDQYRMTDNSITDINKLPGSRIHYEEREYFREAVTTYQLNFPDKFPNIEDIWLNLAAINKVRVAHQLPELMIERRTYDQWIKWWKAGEFDHLVHD
ncbi:hypothetical protein ICN19_09360 [Polynucleobacter sp. AP-Capit-er-40B-B4]|uniref:hypothetical protein n=1 Tax=Polynucleobacter sp. AP-Capit-er-40B-B4 TaxID=2576927 RepID=UPI001C0E4912|nr:hypothetical protein [Polynucleobacter sp. AP-Capit-er-40B-B4]MBU3582216.1 hypothetical protein [Polynucleobacter sp. AP-Capit-er-40B-B4]